MKGLFGTKQDRDLRAIKPILDAVNAFEPEIQKMSDDELKAQTQKFKSRLFHGETLEDIMPEAFATVREASKRVLNMRHYDVQIVGGVVLSQGRIAEMKTGEGKTLTATLPMYLHGLTGRGAHLVTVNDYLASRDAKEMGELYQWLGLSVGCITHDMDDDLRQEAYNADITYGTNNEFAFDYLRDNMKFDLKDYVQKPHHFCIVDEVDSILIDEARTPLLISGPSDGDTELYLKINKIIPQLKKDEHYTVEEKSHTAVLTEDGIVKVQNILGIENMYDMAHVETLHHVNQCLKAHTLFTKDKDYVVQDGQVIIVDEFTGRLKTGSRWSDGLHQAVEAKEGVEVKKENQTLASITFQNYFKLYDRLAGMTGTADTEAEEFQKIYNLDVVVIPTNVPVIREDYPDLIYPSMESKYKAIVEVIKENYEKKRPVLVGTVAIENSEVIATYLDKAKIPYELLNAKQHEREADIIAKAGHPGSITIATNMAGRGTDIKLTEESKQKGGLFIIGTERHESRRIDNQLRGRSGRQGDPGASRFFLSLDDDLMRVFGSARYKDMMIKMGFKEDEPIENKMISNSIAKAQKKVEGHNFDIRKHLLNFDDVMNEQRKVIYKLRKEILDGENNRELLQSFIEEMCFNIIEQHTPEDKTATLQQWDYKALTQSFHQYFSNTQTLSYDECSDKYQSSLEKYLYEKAIEVLDKKFEEHDKELVEMAMKEILLSTFDQFWKDHLLSMDHLKEGINLRSYGQKDPLVEYKREAFQLYNQMKIALKQACVERIYSVHLYTKEEIEAIQREQQRKLDEQMNALKKAQALQENQSFAQAQNKKKIGRNEPCPCGSGKKYKNCHGA